MCSFKFVVNNISVLRCRSVEVKNVEHRLIERVGADYREREDHRPEDVVGYEGHAREELGAE